ncbi:MAG: DUF1343 domain-containing protein [Bacteroidetes bacterium]|nr:DUF1343 domain-containing protein [Bacteroidota bacterium]
MIRISTRQSAIYFFQCQILCLSLLFFSCSTPKAQGSKEKKEEVAARKVIQPGAANVAQYLPLLKGKNIALFANHTSMIGNTHLADTLQRLGVRIKVIFGPEHGFRGKADAGEKVETGIDAATGIPVVSLYGKKLKPSKEDLEGVDVMLFDIQDIGVRFYTYISSLQYYMEAAIEQGKHLIVLDRPNPNGHYIDGPVLEPAFASFVGMQPVPVVYGMTIGEYAQMLLGEYWYDTGTHSRYKDNKDDFELTVIPCVNYDHTQYYTLPVPPSPNLPNMQSIYLYPSLCFFEGTVISEGRGSSAPFQQYGHPLLPDSLHSFTPQSLPGAKNPKLLHQKCYGRTLEGNIDVVKSMVSNRIQLKWLKEAYVLFPDKNQFFLPSKSGKPEDYFFNKLAGNAKLMEQIQQGITEENIRNSWLQGINSFKIIRKRYLLYKDFE